VVELAEGLGLGIELEEEAIPLGQAARGLCEAFGFDPLYVANEGKMVAVVPPEEAPAALEALRGHPLGRQAALIGAVTAEHPGRVLLRTAIGGIRVVDLPAGRQLPRIC